jgi:hypothetical protein
MDGDKQSETKPNPDDLTDGENSKDGETTQ